MNFSFKKIEYAFTIVELLIVTVVIGILSSIAIVSYVGITQKTSDVILMSDLSSISNKLKIYYSLYNSYPISPLDSSNCPVTPVADSNYCIYLSSGNIVSSYISDGSSFTLTSSNTYGSVYRVANDHSPYAVVDQSLTAIAPVTGTFKVGSVVSAGALTPVDAVATYQWQRADTINGSYSNISGATNSTYTLTAGDETKFLKVVATGVTGYTGVQTSASTMRILDSSWIAGLASTVMEGKYVRNVDEGRTTFKTSQTSIVSPQGETGLDPNYPSRMVLVNPQTNPAVDFSSYSAQNTCKSLGGRLANTQELTAIYANRPYYGNNFAQDIYWSATDNSETYAMQVNFINGTGNIATSLKTTLGYVRCVASL